MSISFRDRAIGGSKRHQLLQNTMPTYSIEDLPPSPFADLGLNLSDSELRETAYEILVGACRSSASKPLTFISQSEKTDRTASLSSSASLQRSLTSTAASKVKKALGLKSSLSKKKGGGGDSTAQVKPKRAGTTGELVRVQMRVSEQTDSRIRRAVLRVAAGQLGRRVESMVLPLELIQQMRCSDFHNQQEYEAWMRRNLKLLEAGLLLHPHLPLEKTDPSAKRLRHIIRGALEKNIGGGMNIDSMQALCNAVMLLACRMSDGSLTETCHWADGIPLNLRIYQSLLESCFDVNEETSIIEEVDEVLELIKKTWIVLGMNEMLHNLCFSWVLFHRYVATGQVENDLLFASSNLLAEVEKDAKTITDPSYSKVVSSTLSVILDWAEKKLLRYRDNFHVGNIESMQSVASLGVSSVKLIEDVSFEYHRKKQEADVPRSRVDTYIRSSLRAAFSQKLEKLNSVKSPSNNQNNRLPTLAMLSQDITEIAYNEKEIFSPVLKRWHPLASGVAVATLHSCYGNELKKFVRGISELTPNVVHVLIASDKLEKDLVQIAVEDSVESEDGGKSIIKEMPPFEAEAVIADLAKSWIKTRVDRLEEWLERNLQQEAWNPRANKECFAPSAVEVLRTIDETLEAFFLLPIPMYSVLLPCLISGLDKCLQHYVLKSKSGCGNRNTYMPTMPALTRCSKGSRFNGVFKKKEKFHMTQRRKSQLGATNGNNSFGIPQLCVRINTLQRIRMDLVILEKRILARLASSKSTYVDDVTNGTGAKLVLSAAACVEGIQQLCEAIAYKIVFHDLCHVFWDALYVGEAASSRIEPFLQELEKYLETISSTVHDRVRTRVITDVMKASFDGLLLVLLAGGPSRAFLKQDSDVMEEDFKFLIDLFWSNGDGLPLELIDKHSKRVKAVLTLFDTDTESLIQQFSGLALESYGSDKSRLPLPPTTGEWSPSEPNTILRVLCYRQDETAAKFLKKTYNLPKKL